ncbi:MAG: family 10 glycosylhydrolase, partial [Verrucomicrobia bacterium]|nr:family 10 glycosylhydrolase [Verrucomicrobiota bacterium]
MSFICPCLPVGYRLKTGKSRPRWAWAWGRSFQRTRTFLRLAIVLAVLGTTFPTQAGTYELSRVIPPEPVREFRGVWVATVANIDWPSVKTLSTREQQAELRAILDRAAQLKLNVVIFQIRPACDALYASRFEPWSEFLTGTMGKPPEPFYDPLAFAVEEAHKRGLELHAWFNPYRARLLGTKSPAAPNHISRARPQLVRQYGEFLWLDPGEKEVQDYSLNVVMDVLRRYDVDGIHFDDYFYPYKAHDSSGRDLDFPDDLSWRRFGAGGKLSREDWRRENVNQFIQRVYKSIKAVKPWVKFGVSPFGIWRPTYPPPIRGLDAYAMLYADSRKWLVNGWVDYFAPQLYWEIDAPDRSFRALLRWWAEQNPKGRTLVPGMDSTRIGGKSNFQAPWQPREIVNQIRLTRTQRGVSGH